MGEKKRINFRLRTAPDVRRALSRITNMLANNEISTQKANSLILACNAVLNSIRTDEQQKKIDELEEMLNRIEGQR